MTCQCTLLLLEDEPLIQMDLQMAAEDMGCETLVASSSEEAMALLESNHGIDGAVLDVSLGNGKTCEPVAQCLASRSTPFILHSGDLDRQDETIRTFKARLIAKPASADRVIAAALAEAGLEIPKSA